MATGSYGGGVYGTDSYGEVVVPSVVPSPRDRPPLQVTIEVETPSGQYYRWAEDEPDPANVPSGLRFSDTMPGGFESMDCVLPRKAGTDYSDLEQLSTIRVLGASGDVAGEYRLERAPRTAGDQMSISPGAVGWQAHLEDDKSAFQNYVNRDLSLWGAASPQFKVDREAVQRIEEPQVAPSADSTPALVATVVGPWATTPGLPRSIAMWQGAPIGRLYATWTRGANVVDADTNWIWAGYLSSTSSGAVFEDSTGNLRAAGPGSFVLDATDDRYVAYLDLSYQTGPAGTDNVEYPIFWENVAVYGDHGLGYWSAPGAPATEPWGIIASAVVRHAVGRWAPALITTSESVQPSGFVIPHLSFLELTTAGEMIRQATRFGLQDWAVWDNKTFWWHERGAFSKQWRARVAPAQLDETGPQVDRLWESIIVQYQDVDGTTRTVGPPGSGASVTNASLKNDDPDNPANQLGIIRRDVLQMGTSTSAGAIEVGRRFLEQTQQLDRSGRARIVGHVEDDCGVLHPYWRPRAGDYISFTDAADTSPRRIVKTDKDHSTRTCGLDLDAPPEGLQALLERLGVVLVPLGVG